MSTPSPTPPATPEPAKAASPRVPTITLQRAIDLMKTLWEHEKRNAAHVSSVLPHWGFGSKSSAGYQAVASMKRFGLVVEEGSNEKRTVKLSDLALRLLKNETVDPSKYAEELKEVALHPKFHRTIWEKYGHELPSDATLGKVLEFDHHFDTSGANLFLKQFKETISFAKLMSGDTVAEPESEENAEGVTPRKTGQTQLSVDPAPKHSPPPKKPPMNAELRYLPIPLDIGDAPIPVGMSEDDFELLLDTLKLWKRRIVKAEYPKRAVWHNNDSDTPVTITGYMGDKDGEKYFRSSDGTGIPSSELSFPQS